jgi:hypothetical protein
MAPHLPLTAVPTAPSIADALTNPPVSVNLQNIIDEGSKTVRGLQASSCYRPPVSPALLMLRFGFSGSAAPSAASAACTKCCSSNDSVPPWTCRLASRTVCMPYGQFYDSGCSSQQDVAGAMAQEHRVHMTTMGCHPCRWWANDGLLGQNTAVLLRG